MALIVPPQQIVIPQHEVVLPSFRVRFINGTTSVDLSLAQMQANTSMGRTSNRTDGTAAGSAQLTFDDHERKLDPDNPDSPLYGKLTPGGDTTVVLDCGVPNFGYIPLYTGLLEDLGTTWPDDPIWSSATVQLVDMQRDLTEHIQAVNVTYPMQQTGARIAQMVGAPARSGWGWLNRAPSGQFAIDTGCKMLGALTTDGNTDTWTYLADAAAAEDGLVFFNQGGVLTFQGRNHRSQQTTPLWVFGENNGELHYNPGIAMDLPNDRLVKDVAYDTLDGVTSGYGPGGKFAWDTSAAKQSYTPSKVQASSQQTQLASRYTGASRARSEYRRFSVNRRDIPVIEINAYVDWQTITPGDASNRAWAALNAQVGDLVTVNRRPPGVAISKNYFIDAIKHTISATSWVTQFYLVDVSATVPGWVLGQKLGSIQLSW